MLHDYFAAEKAASQQGELSCQATSITQSKESSPVKQDKLCETPQASLRSMNVSTQADGKRVLCPAIPVRVSAMGSQTEILTYMGLDSYASDCFVDAALLKSLGAKSESASIKITTMSSSCSPVETRLVKNLQIKSLDG